MFKYKVIGSAGMLNCMVEKSPKDTRKKTKVTKLK